MNLLASWSVLFFVCCAQSAVIWRHKSNDRPIIGVLAQEVYDSNDSYIAASYVKFLEMAGARVVPVMLNQSRTEYERLFNSINGVLFPGGGVNITTSSYAKTSKIFFDLAIQANSKGDYFPIWGTCLGFEALMYLTSGEFLFRHTNTTGVSLPLAFTKASRQSRLFKNFPEDLLDAMATEPLTANAHRWSLSVETFNQRPELKRFYKMLTTNTDGQVEFVSTVEGIDFPFYATQWHPEKNAFEWEFAYYPHSQAALKATFFVADFFVNEAKKNFHGFRSKEEEERALIYNYVPVYSGIRHASFEQIYIFHT